MTMVRYPQPITAAMVLPKYVPAFTWNGGTFGDETQSETNVVIDDRGIGDYAPRNLTEELVNHKPGDPDFVPAPDITQPRGWIAPGQPITAKPVSPTDDPTVTSLTPNTAPSGGANPPVWVVITGTKFTPYSQVETGGVITPYVRYGSATKMHVLMDAPRSTAGVISVRVIDHGVKSATSANSNFTFT